MKKLLLILPLLVLTACSEPKLIGKFVVVEIGTCDRYADCSVVLQNKVTKQKIYIERLYRPVKGLQYKCYEDNQYTYCSNEGLIQ